MSLNSWLNARERTATLSVVPCAATAAALRGSGWARSWPCAAEKSAKLRATTKTSFFIQPRPKPTLPEYKELRRCDSIPSRPTEFLPPPRPSFCTTCRISVVVFPWASHPRAATLAALLLSRPRASGYWADFERMIQLSENEGGLNRSMQHHLI